MALENKILFVSQSRTGREITIKDATGLQSNGRLTGYGSGTITPESILAYHIVVSRMIDNVPYTLKIDGSESLLPSPVQLAYGTPLRLTTGLFEEETERGVTEPSCIFNDGILDLNMYVETLGLTGLTIEKDTNYIIDSQNRLGPALEADAVIVNGAIYEINKDPEYFDNGNQILYVNGEFSEEATSFNILYRANTKALLIAMSDHYHAYGAVQLRNNTDSPEWVKINTAASFREAARLLFNAEVPDYYQANELVQSNFKLLKRYAI